MKLQFVLKGMDYQGISLAGKLVFENSPDKKTKVASIRLTL